MMTDVACALLTVTVAILLCYLGYCLGNLRMLMQTRRWIDALDEGYERLHRVALDLLAILESTEEASPCVEHCVHADECAEAGVCWYEYQIGERDVLV